MDYCYKSTLICYSIGYFIYLIFGLVYLIDYFKISYECTQSYIWEYVLVSIFIGTIGFINRYIYRKADIQDYLYLLACLSSVDFCVAIWGGVELTNNSCTKLHNTPLLAFAFITFLIQIFTSISCFLFNCLYTLFMYRHHFDYNEV